MAMDKAVDSAQLNADLTTVADAIRTKGGTDAQLAFPDGFVSAVQAIEGAPDLNIVVTAVKNAAVTATKGTESVSGTAGSNDGVCTLTVPSAGTWTVTATSPSGGTASTTCVVGFNYALTIPFTFTVKWHDANTGNTYNRYENAREHHCVIFNGTKYYVSTTEADRTFSYTQGEDELKFAVGASETYANNLSVTLADTSLGTLKLLSTENSTWTTSSSSTIKSVIKTYAFTPAKDVLISLVDAYNTWHEVTITALES